MSTRTEKLLEMAKVVVEQQNDNSYGSGDSEDYHDSATDEPVLEYYVSSDGALVSNNHSCLNQDDRFPEAMMVEPGGIEELDNDSLINAAELAEIALKKAGERPFNILKAVGNQDCGEASVQGIDKNEGEEGDKEEHEEERNADRGNEGRLNHKDEINEDQENQENESEIKENRVANARKKKCQPHKWKRNIRQKLYQEGKEYTSVRGKKVAAKQICNFKDCMQHCKFNCAKNITATERKAIFDYYYALLCNEKYLFLKHNTERYQKFRKTVEDNSRRNYTFRYFFKVQEKKIRVCKNYFLGTLNISQKPVYTAHASNASGIPKKNLRGKTSTRKISEARKQAVMDHIQKFCVVESHYCRANTKRKYLESTLNISKMYELYLIYCTENEINDPVRLSMYRTIFNTCFNYGFHVPKKDVCEKCTTYFLSKKEKRLTFALEEEMQTHLTEKEAMRKEKDQDKKSNIPVLCFDLENVITCPRSFVGNHFYLPKLTIYNLTGHLSTTKKGYCAIWTEATQGRSGNCLASAFKKIVGRVLIDNSIEELITWSDSCVPQNRNSFISFCVLDILRNHPELKGITMKYSVPGHGCVQEVDNIHSQIERHMGKIEFYSPLSFLKELKKVNKRNPLTLLQMKDDDFFNFEQCSSKLKYSAVPFSKVSTLKFTNENLHVVRYKLGHSSPIYQEAVIWNYAAPPLTRKKKQIKENKSPMLTTLIPAMLPVKDDTISKDKIEAIKKMFSSMPDLDKDFYSAFFRIEK